jgi:hypothetical protein
MVLSQTRHYSRVSGQAAETLLPSAFGKGVSISQITVRGLSVFSAEMPPQFIFI